MNGCLRFTSRRAPSTRQSHSAQAGGEAWSSRSRAPVTCASHVTSLSNGMAVAPLRSSPAMNSPTNQRIRRSKLCCSMSFTASFLAIVILQRFGAEQPAFRRADKPFSTVRVMAGFADRIIRHDVQDQFVCAVINHLVRFPRLENKGVTSFDRSLAILVPDDALSRNDVRSEEHTSELQS